MELVDAFKTCETLFRRRCIVPTEIKVNTMLCYDENQLFKQRCKLTPDSRIRAHISEMKPRYRHVSGFFLIPPEDGRFTVLLVYKPGREEYCAYNYIHEFQHVCNYYDYMRISKATDPLAHLEDHSFYLWDEFFARYTSTLVMGDFFSDVPTADITEFFNTVCNSLYEITGNNVDSYSGMQVLGAVSACIDLNIDTEAYSKFGDEEKSLLEHYRSIKSVSQIIQKSKLK